jgi:hypothetical protein
MSNRERPWSVPVRVDDIPEMGCHVELAADDLTRRAIADLAGLRALPRLEAVFDLSRHGRNGLRLTGRVTALAGQTCVVTLDPIDGAVTEDVDLVFAPPRPPADSAHDPRDLPQGLAIDASDESEELVDGAVDLGAVATESLLLGLDPYPRKPGAEFAVPPAPETKEGPFAALAALKTGRKPGA